MEPTADAGAPTDAPPPAPVAAIDLEHLARMTLGERSLEAEVLTLFDLQAGVLLARMRDSAPAAVAAFAHTLKGSARGIGAWRVAEAADCGTEVNLYMRPKIGFCNCQTGVADDPELDRVGDLDLVGSERSAPGPGRPITVHGMKGRSRSYKVGAPAGKSVLSLAFNNRCDVVVATVVAGDEPAAHEQAVLEFLNGDLVLHWAEVVLGL